MRDISEKQKPKKMQHIIIRTECSIIWWAHCIILLKKKKTSESFQTEMKLFADIKHCHSSDNLSWLILDKLYKASPEWCLRHDQQSLKQR